MGVSRSSCQEHRVRVPCQGSNCASNRLLNMLRDPPVVLFFKITDSNSPGPGAYSEFGFRWRPTDERRSTVDSQKDKCRLVTRWRWLPNKSIPVYSKSMLDKRTQHNLQCWHIPWEQVTILPLCRATSTPVTVLSCPFSSSLSLNPLPERPYSSTFVSRATARVCLSAEKEWSAIGLWKSW